MSAFLIAGKMITDKNDIREMWAEHFEKLGTPSTNTNFDSVFLDRVGASVQEFMQNIKKYAERRGFFLKMQFGF